MPRCFWLPCLFLVAFATRARAQDKLANLGRAAYQAHHFNGTLLTGKDNRIVSQMSQGEANFQFGVPGS